MLNIMSFGFNQEVWNEMINRVNQHLEKDEYAAAVNVLNNYYNDYKNGEADAFYYRNRCLISICYYEKLNADSEQVAEIEKEIRKFLKEMKAMSNGDKDLLDDYQSLKDRFKTDRKNKKKEFNAIMDRRNNLLNRIDNLIGAQEYDLALQELENHFLNYEDEKDFNYNYIVLKNTILTDGGKYDEAKAYIESYFPNKGYDYYQQMSRIESLRLQDAVKKQLPKETVKKILDDAKFNMNIAIEIQEDAQEKEEVKSNVLPRIKEGELYIESGNNNSKSQSTSAVSTNSIHMENLLTKDAVIELIKECSRAKCVSTDTRLEEIGITPLEVIEAIFQDTGERGYEEINIAKDGKKITATINVVELSKPINEIFTIKDMAKVIEKSYKDLENEVLIYEDGEGYDVIAEYVGEEGEEAWYTLMNNIACAHLVSKKLINRINEEYGVVIERKSIMKYNGSVLELAEYLYDCIKKALEVQKK